MREKMVKWNVPSDPEAWPETGRVMNAQEAAVTFNALIDRLTGIDKLARELAEAVIRTVPGPDRKGDPVSILRKLARRLSRLLN